MAVCDSCGQEMTAGVSCVEVPVRLADGRTLAPVRYGQGRLGVDWRGPGDARPCHDCLTPLGGFHHPGCDAESCPNCGGQVISCGCLSDDDDEGEGA
jgi:hypothetical protein